jgi:aminoglycoside phosphotransferase (APT) family kinase protein
VAELEPAERETMWWSGLRALADVHCADWRGLGLGFLDETAASGGDDLDRHIAEYEHMLAWSNGKPQPNLESALRWLRLHRPPPGEPRVLCWGDSRLGNQIFQSSRCAAVLDWEMARIGSPEADLAWWIYMDRHHSEGANVPRLAGLPGRSETVERYEEWTGHRVRHLEYYEVFAALRFAVIMIRVGQQLEHYGFLPKDSGFEVNNSSTQLLARLLGLPAPG